MKVGRKPHEDGAKLLESIEVNDIIETVFKSRNGEETIRKFKALSKPYTTTIKFKDIFGKDKEKQSRLKIDVEWLDSKETIECVGFTKWTKIEGIN